MIATSAHQKKSLKQWLRTAPAPALVLLYFFCFSPGSLLADEAENVIDAQEVVRQTLPEEPDLITPEPEPFRLPTEQPIDDYEILWKESPFTRNSSPDADKFSAPAQYVLEAWTGSEEQNDLRLYVRPRVKDAKAKGIEWVIISNDGPQEGNKLLAFNYAESFKELSAEVEIQGRKYTVKYDEQALKKPLRPISPGGIRRPSTTNRPDIQVPNTIRRPTTPTTSTNNSAVRRPRIIRKPAPIRRPTTNQ
ncbi:MAG: hypothetical protein AAGA18_02420 [Verrucomicrobiota bacterium]